MVHNKEVYKRRTQIEICKTLQLTKHCLLKLSNLVDIPCFQISRHFRLCLPSHSVQMRIAENDEKKIYDLTLLSVHLILPPSSNRPSPRCYGNRTKWLLRPPPTRAMVYKGFPRLHIFREPVPFATSACLVYSNLHFEMFRVSTIYTLCSVAYYFYLIKFVLC